MGAGVILLLLRVHGQPHMCLYFGRVPSNVGSRGAFFSPEAKGRDFRSWVQGKGAETIDDEARVAQRPFVSFRVSVCAARTLNATLSLQ